MNGRATSSHSLRLLRYVSRIDYLRELCRDQRVLFKRDIAWVRRCGRSVGECPQHLCMPAIGAIGSLS